MSKFSKIRYVLFKLLSIFLGFVFYKYGILTLAVLAIIKSSELNKYSDFVKLVDALKFAGAQPIEIQIEDINQ